MQITLSAIKHLIRTGAAIDVTGDKTITRRPPNSTIVFYSAGINGLNGVVIMDNVTGKLYAVAGRCHPLHALAA
jgi:hypothetical protein